MQTFLPYEDYAESAKVLDANRLNSQLNESLVIVRSLFRQYPVKKSGKSGWEGHTVVEMWRDCELQLARYAKACAFEYLYNRPLAVNNEAKSLTSRKARFSFWNDLIEKLEDEGYPDTKIEHLGDEEFHSAFRALLLFKDIQYATFRAWKQNEYPDHAAVRNLPPAKRSWVRSDYEKIWEFFGQPEAPWYGQWGWDEEPDDQRVFYSSDRIPQALKEAKRKKEKPIPTYYKKAKDYADETK